MRRLALIVFLVTLFVAVGAGGALAADPIKIGIVSPQSGNYADHGKLERMGMEMAVEDFGGKVLDRPIQLIPVDDETNPDAAARRARRLVEVDGAKFMMGGVSSSTALSVGAVAEEKKVLFIATNQNADDVTGVSARHYVFRAPHSMAMLVRAVAPDAAKLGKKWFFLTHDYSWGHSGTFWGRKMLQKVGATEVGEIKVPMGTRDFSSQLLQIRSSGADVLVITVAGFDNVALLKQMNELKIYDKVKVWYTLLDIIDMQVVPPSDRNAYAGVEVFYKETPELEKFSQRMIKKYPDSPIPVVDTTTYYGWLSMKALLEGIKKAGSDDVEKVICAMEGMEIKDAMRKSPVTIRAWDHQFISPVDFVQVKPNITKNLDWAELRGVIPGESVARTKEENLTKEGKPVDVSCKK